jgi:hypothetical protein
MSNRSALNNKRTGQDKGDLRIALFNPMSNPKCVRFVGIFKYLAVPNSLVSCWKYLLFPLCHGRGREFESRRPRHLFKHLQRIQKKIWVRLGPISLRSTLPAA